MPHHRHVALLASALLAVPLAAALPMTGAAAETAVGAAEGESFALASTLGQVRSDATAQGGRSLLVWSNGTAERVVRATAPATSLLVRARGDQCGGAPTMRVTVDGTVRATTVVSSATWTTVRVPVAVGAGDRRVGVAFTNDYRTTTCDRNLHVDAVTFTATSSPTPVAPPTAGPVPAPATGSLVFNADVANRGLAAYASTHNANRVSIVDDPVLGDRRKVTRFTVYDSDDQLTGNPRAQLETAKFWQAGQEHYVGMSFYFPQDFPMQQDTKQWLNLGEVYGPPYAGASPNGLFVKRVSTGGQVIAWQRNGQYGWDRPFELPLVKGRWHDLVFRIKLSSDPQVGFWEAWANTGGGWQRLKLKGMDRLYSQTIDPSNNGGGNYHKLAHYRSKGMWPVATHFAADHRIGSSFEAVAPRSYS